MSDETNVTEIEVKENLLLDLIGREEKPSKDELEEALSDLHPADIADMLEDIDDEQGIKLVFSYEDKEFLAEVLELADDHIQTKIVNILDYPSIIELFSYMSKDDITDILGDLDFNVQKSLLKLMKKSDSRELQVLLGYDEDTAGGIMTTEYIAVYENMSVEEVISKLREIAPKTEVIEFIFITNKQKQLVGLVDLRDILSSPSETLISEIMDDNVISVYPEIDQEEVIQVVQKYDLNVLPVVNHRNGLLGIVTADDVIDVMVEEQTEDILRLGGVNEEEKIGGPFLGSVKKRLPWLLINLLTAFVAAFVIHAFEGVIAKVVALAMAMTVVSGMGGNAATQTLSIVIRSITLGEVNLVEDWKYIFKELLVGIVDGLVTGIAAGFIMYYIYGNWYLGVVILLAMVGNLVFAAIAGFFIPLIVKKFGGDPALVSTIFVTTVTDTCGFALYLGIAKLFMSYLT